MDYMTAQKKIKLIEKTLTKLNVDGDFLCELQQSILINPSNITDMWPIACSYNKIQNNNFKDTDTEYKYEKIYSVNVMKESVGELVWVGINSTYNLTRDEWLMLMYFSNELYFSYEQLKSFFKLIGKNHIE